jgi:very-short-patch-repair endonuclease
MQPFIGSAAVRRGELSRRALAREHVAIYRDVYLHRDVELTALVRARAAWLATGATLAGASAAAVHGTKWLDASAPAEVLRSDQHEVAGLVAHTWAVTADEVCVVGGVDVTTAARTAYDIGRTRSPVQAIPILDALFNATGLKHEEVSAVAAMHPGARGAAQLRSLLPNVDGGAESPQETRLRLILVAAGLPRPETQIRFPQLHIRVDMGWREWKVAVEYDGVQHWADGRQRAWDIERIALLEAAGWVVVRVSADMMARPDLIAARVRDKLRARGCPV